MRGIIPCRESKCYSFADTKQYSDNGMWYVECPTCHSKTGENITEFEAIREWKEQCGAIKDDDGKLRYDLIPISPLRQLASVYTHGAVKYGAHNWRKGMRWGRVYAAVQRHLNAWWGGEENDEEDSLSHLAHAAWGLFTLMEYSELEVNTAANFDDRIYVLGDFDGVFEGDREGLTL